MAWLCITLVRGGSFLISLNPDSLHWRDSGSRMRWEVMPLVAPRTEWEAWGDRVAFSVTPQAKVLVGVLYDVSLRSQGLLFLF